jgi:predicted AlkP superfamily phosphohydrolase/phosphomutase
MDGGICINEWLWREGYLVFKNDPKSGEITPLEELEIDWSRTRAWGSGGYYGRVFLNVQDRETQGVIPESSYEDFRDELAEKIRSISGHEGEDINTRVFKPQEIYRTVNGVAPDLMVYFGDLFWRSVGSLGHGTIHTFENDIGPDDCNHAQNGLFILYDPQNKSKGREIKDADLVDVTITILELLDVPFPHDLQGRNLIRDGG